MAGSGAVSRKDVPLSELVMVCHSLGVAAALDCIEQADGPVKSLVSVAGFADDYGSELNTDYMQQKIIDFKKVRKNLQQARVVFADNDPYVPQPILRALAEKLDVEPIIITNGGHLNTDAGFTEFPLLMELIDQIQQS